MRTLLFNTASQREPTNTNALFPSSLFSKERFYKKYKIHFTNISKSLVCLSRKALFWNNTKEFEGALASVLNLMCFCGWDRVTNAHDKGDCNGRFHL